MRVGSIATTLLGAALACSGALAGNIDTGGFAMDGVTTYCQGINGGSTFANLESNSINRCPILVNLTPGATTVHKNEALELKFKAQAKFGDIPGNIFPKVIVNGKVDKGVDSSFIKYCKINTNCAQVMDTTPFGAESATGNFDATGAKTFQSSRVTFTDPGEYVVFGQATLPGDADLKVSGIQFVTFVKITVVDTGVAIAPSPSPTPSMPAASATPAPSATSAAPAATNSTNGTSVGFDSINKTSGSVAAEAAGSVKASAPAPIVATEIPTEGTSTNAGEKDKEGFFASNGALLGAVAGGCVVVVIIGYVVAMRRKKSSVQGGKLGRGQTPTFRASHSDNMDDPEPVAYISKKTTRNSVNQHSLPILGGAGTSSSSTDDMPMDIHKRGSEMEPSFDNSSYEEGTVTASNKAIPTQARAQQQTQQQYHHSRPSGDMAPASLYDDRDTALYQGTAGQSVRESEQESEFYQSTGWDAAATARPYDDQREVSTISFNDDSNSRRGFGAPSFASDTIEEFEEGRTTRFNSEASVDSYAFRPSRASVAESYQSRVSRYSYADSELDRESSRISGMSLYSERGTNV